MKSKLFLMIAALLGLFADLGCESQTAGLNNEAGLNEPPTNPPGPGAPIPGDKPDPSRQPEPETPILELPGGTEFIAGINNVSGTCYLNAGLQAMFTADGLNNYARRFSGDVNFTNNQFFQQYLVAIERYRNKSPLRGSMVVEDLQELKSREHDSFLALQIFLTSINQMPNAQNYFANMNFTVNQLSTSTVEALVTRDFQDRATRGAVVPPLYIIVMLSNENGRLFTAAQQNKISFDHLAPIAGSNSRYSLVSAVETCYEGPNNVYNQPNHVVAYKKANGQWYFANDSQVEPRSADHVKAQINSGNATERVPGRESKFMIPATLIYQRHGS